MFFKKLIPKGYSDAAYVEGVYKRDEIIEKALHNHCKDYYEKTFHKSEVGTEGIKDIFQSSLLALWQNIRNHIIYVEDGVLKGKDGQAFTSALTTYFMSIVNNKYLEWLRKNSYAPPVGPGVSEMPIDDDIAISDFVYDDDTIRKLSVIANRISHMAKRCNQILTLYYYEEKGYDEILMLMPSFTSRDALKTAKYKCLKRLRDSVNGTYC